MLLSICLRPFSFYNFKINNLFAEEKKKTISLYHKDKKLWKAIEKSSEENRDK